MWASRLGHPLAPQIPQVTYPWLRQALARQVFHGELQRPALPYNAASNPSFRIEQAMLPTEPKAELRLVYRVRLSCSNSPIRTTAQSIMSNLLCFKCSSAFGDLCFAGADAASRRSHAPCARRTTSCREEGEDSLLEETLMVHKFPQSIIIFHAPQSLLGRKEPEESPVSLEL
ncbi:hypothetical protein BHM03_00045143 [Ensete ventricosum]|nr:hypothetical protein BHM03_00045143 [Ensete ventricosum]